LKEEDKNVNQTCAIEVRRNKIEVSLSSWILLTQDDQILVPLDWVVTIVEPLNSVKDLYEERVNGQNS